MQLINLDKDKVLEKAQVRFPDKYIELDSADLYLEDMESGHINIEGIEHELFVSTHYVYENHIVNGNKTRYKVPLTIVLLKKDAYDVIYDSRGKCYVAYEDNDINFILYEDFQDFIFPMVHEIKELDA